MLCERGKIIFNMFHRISFVVLVLVIQATNRGQAAPLAGTHFTETKTTETEIVNDLLEGDMIIDQTLLDIISNETVETKRGARIGVSLWPNGVVPYVINSRLSGYSRIIYQAIAELHASTCIKFQPRTNETDYVEFIRGTGCYSHVGKQNSRQVISLGRGCEAVKIALHEMVHTLGFFHTSSRTDRDSYVIVYENNIKPGMAHNFHKYSHGQIDHLNSPYDVTSIMHLPRHAFAKYSYLMTIQARAGAHIKLGEANQLSPVDKYQINSLYKCSSTTSTSSCLTALGLQSRSIPDSAIKASSHSYWYSASAARLHEMPSRYNMGAWCPNTNADSWIQIDIGKRMRITGIATQGRRDVIFGDAYTPTYDLKYKQFYSNSWVSYLSTSRAYAGTQGLPGNWDGGSVQYNALCPTFVARYVRLYPKTWKKRPCFRVELYGCKI